MIHINETPERVFWCASGTCRLRFQSRRNLTAPVAYPMLDYPEVSVRQPASELFIHYHAECAPRTPEPRVAE